LYYESDIFDYPFGTKTTFSLVIIYIDIYVVWTECNGPFCVMNNE